MKSMAEAAKAAGVPVVTGDTKVVERARVTGVHHHTGSALSAWL